MYDLKQKGDHSSWSGACNNICIWGVSMYQNGVSFYENPRIVHHLKSQMRSYGYCSVYMYDLRGNVSKGYLGVYFVLYYTARILARQTKGWQE